MKNQTYKANLPVATYRPGDIFRILVHDDGTPIDIYWRKRLRDAQRDNCIERVDTEKKESKTTKSKRAE